jgi:hypothetical protein
MEKQKIQELILRYNSGQASAEDVKHIEWLLEEGNIDLTALKDMQRMEDDLLKIQHPSPSASLDQRFHKMLAQELKSKSSFSWGRFFSWPELAPKLAFASVTLLLGIAIGYFVKPSGPSGNQQIELLSEQVSEMKEMMMLNLLEKESATDRLKAVSLTSEMNEASMKVTTALLQTLNNDENINVRLAALEALKPYVRNINVRKELILSIAKQDSPLVQVSLAEVMAEFQVKSSVKELEKIMQSDKTPADVKTRIKQSIDVLI